MAEQHEESRQAVAARRAESLESRAALVKSSRALMPYGTPQELAEMVGRFKMMIPAGDRLKDNEIMALAQAAYVHGLNPIIGECYWIPGSGFMPGIRGLRRKGREQLLVDQDAQMTTDFVQLVEAREREAEKIPEGALAFKCVGYNTTKRSKWAQDAKTLREALGPDAPYEVMLKQIGPMPTTVGIGYVTIEQMDDLDNPRWYHECSVKGENTKFAYGKRQREMRGKAPCSDCGAISRAKENAMPHAQRARKRAEAHMWKQECDLPFEIRPDSDTEWETAGETPTPPDFVEGEFRPATQAEMESHLTLEAEEAERRADRARQTPEERKTRAKTAGDMLYGTDGPAPRVEGPAAAEAAFPHDAEPKPIGKSAPRAGGTGKEMWDAAYILAVRGDGKFFPKTEASQHVVGVLNLSPFHNGDPVAWVVEWVGLYLAIKKFEEDHGEKHIATVTAEGTTRQFLMAHEGEPDVAAAFGKTTPA